MADEKYHIRADVKGANNGSWTYSVPDMGTIEPLMTDADTAKQTCEWLRNRAPDTDTFTAVSGKPPLRPLYDWSRLGEKPREEPKG